MEAYLQKTPAETLKPPVTSVGVIGWARSNLFNGWLNSLLTIVTLYFLWIVIPPLIRWAFIDSVWNTSGAVCRDADGACWSIIATNFRFILFGFFPYDQQWRPLIAMLILFGLLFYSRDRNHWTQHLIYAWIIGLVMMGVLMRGGILWLSSVEATCLDHRPGDDGSPHERWDPLVIFGGSHTMGWLASDTVIIHFWSYGCVSLGRYSCPGAPVQNADHQMDVYRLH
jgi:hypothetical protein